MDKQTVEKANKIIKKIKIIKKEVDYLQEYIKEGVIVYFKKDYNNMYNIFPVYDPLFLTKDDVLCLINIKKESIKKLEEELNEL